MPGLAFLETVNLEGLAPAGEHILATLARLAVAENATITVTCGREAHGPLDPHTLGRAFDVRTKDLTDAAAIIRRYQKLKAFLGPDFTVLFETPVKLSGPLASIQSVNAGASAQHLHVQLRMGYGDWPKPKTANA